MNKAKFLELVKDPGLIKEKDQNKLKNLTAEHPYSQIIHALNVKGCKIWDHPDFEKMLNLAAVYSYDRNVLHALIERVNEENQEDILQTLPADLESTPEASDEVVEEVSDFEWINEDPHEEPPVQSLKETSSDLDTTEVTQSIDATPALETKEQVNQSLAEDIEKEKDKEKEQTIDTAKAESKEASVTSKSSNQKEDSMVEPSTPPEDEKSEELSSPLQSENLSPESIEEVNNAQQPDPKQDEDSLNLEIEESGIHAELMKNLNQLKKNKQQYKGERAENADANSHEQQTEIVDNFIKNSPLLSKPNLNAESEIMSQKDLSKASIKFSSDLASENLAKIFLKQGKRKDAEKIYEKLIIKFPQKKTYFADQIKNLKKK